MVAVDLAISKETDAFHPHKQTRLYGVTTALSQCPQGNPPVLLLVRGWGALAAPCLGSRSPEHMAGETQPLPSRVFII